MSRQSGPNRNESGPEFTHPLTVENAMDLLFEEMREQSSETDVDASNEFGEEADVIDLKQHQDPTESDPQNPQT